MYKIAAAAIGLIIASHSAQAAERVFTVTDFDKVQVDGTYRVVLTTGGASSARASGDRAALDRLSVGVQGNTLRIRSDSNAWGSSRDGQGPVTVTLATRSLRSALVNGSGSLDIGKVQAMRLDLSVAGSGTIDASSISTDSLFLNLLGSGSLAVGGKTKSAKVELHGSGNVDAGGLMVDDAQIAADSSGNVKMNVLRSAKINASGAGDVEIVGRPACTVKALGTGEVRCGR